jgi:hypothetical protein
MTAFITLCWKKRLERVALLAFCWLWLAAAQAGSIETKSAALVADEQGYALNAEFDLRIGARLEDAVSRGVPLHFRFEILIKRKRWYWADEHVAGRVLDYRLSYQALTRQYRLTQGGLHRNFESLEEALHALGRIGRLPVADNATLPAGQPVTVALRLSLDHTELPKPLQIDAMSDRDWRVEAKTHSWQFVPAPAH